MLQLEVHLITTEWKSKKISNISLTFECIHQTLRHQDSTYSNIPYKTLINSFAL